MTQHHTILYVTFALRERERVNTKKILLFKDTTLSYITFVLIESE